MAVFAISDLHLSLGTDKPMDVFGGNWDGYVEKLEKNWRECILPEDTVVIPGDISWAMKLTETVNDFRFLESLPGEKLIGKGNHDYWWSSVTKMSAFCDEMGFGSIKFLYNNAYVREGIVICGSRGWMIDGSDDADKKIQEREGIRLRISLEEAKKVCADGQIPTVFLHYPPVHRGKVCEPIMDALREYGIRHIYYGHLHGIKKDSLTYLYDNIRMTPISADLINFKPVLVE